MTEKETSQLKMLTHRW